MLLLKKKFQEIAMNIVYSTFFLRYLVITTLKSTGK